MIRQQLLSHGVRGDRRFRWRGEDVSRVEGLSDAVFAFAITLLVVSLEVPRTFEQLAGAMRGFLAFGLCFAILVFIWHSHYIFFRRYAIRDLYTITINALLLFVVLFYIYPLKFLFTYLIGSWTGFEHGMPAIRKDQMPWLMVIYSAGFLTISLLFILLFLHAWRKRGALALSPVEVALTRESLQAHGIYAGIAFVSIVIAIAGGPDRAPLAGLIYVLIGPVRAVHGYFTENRIEALARRAG